MEAVWSKHEALMRGWQKRRGMLVEAARRPRGGSGVSARCTGHSEKRLMHWIQCSTGVLKKGLDMKENLVEVPQEAMSGGSG